MYADDTSLIVSGKNLSEAETHSNVLLGSLYNWFCSNKLLLNPTKTEVVVFHTPQNKNDHKISVNIEGSNLKQVSHTKFLGLHLDQHLDWSIHCAHIIKKLNIVCYQLRVLSTILNITSLIEVYYANAQSLIAYGIIFWGNSSSTKQVFVVQKRLIRTITKCKRNVSCRTKFRKLKILTLCCLYIFEISVLIFKNQNYFSRQSENHLYDTRIKNTFNLPKYRLTLSQKGPNYIGLKIFNHLPNSIKNAANLNAFKKALKIFLIDNEFYFIQDFFNVKF